MRIHLNKDDRKRAKEMGASNTMIRNCRIRASLEAISHFWNIIEDEIEIRKEEVKSK